MTARMQVADQTIYHDRERASYVVLPVVPVERAFGDSAFQKNSTSKR